MLSDSYDTVILLMARVDIPRHKTQESIDDFLNNDEIHTVKLLREDVVLVRCVYIK